MVKSPVYGAGINDADYVTKVQENLGRFNGKQKQRVVWRCPYYARWCDMLRRCYSKTFKNKNLTYLDCIVCDEWLYFSKFKSWMETQDWEGKQLDKDILIAGNKIYSPDTCIFVTKALNLFVMESFTKLGPYPSGVYWNKKNEKFYAACKDPLNRFPSHLGVYETANEAHIEWINKKIEYSYELDVDDKVRNALIERYMIMLDKAQAKQDDLQGKAEELTKLQEIQNTYSK